MSVKAPPSYTHRIANRLRAWLNSLTRLWIVIIRRLAGAGKSAVARNRGV